MALFSKENVEKGYLGVDIGGSSIKMVELASNQGRAQLLTYGYLERSIKSASESLLNNPDEMAEAIKKVVKQAKVKTNNAITALPSSAVFSTIISLPEITRKDLQSTKKVTAAVEYEAKKVLPLPVEDMILDWKILGQEAKPTDNPAALGDKVKNLQVLLTAAAKTLVQKYIDIFKKAGLNLTSLETESFALSRALVGKDKSTVLIVDIGASNSVIIVVDNMIPYIDRSVNVGGYTITEALANTMKVSIKQAEQFKRDLAHHSQQLPEGVLLPPMVEKGITPINNEIKYLIEFFGKQPGNAEKRFDRIILSGGNSRMFNLPEYFTNKFNIRTFLGDPWARIIYPEDLKPILDEVGSRLTVAVGLAMREIEK